MLYKIYYLLGRVLESKKKWELALSFYLKIPNNTIANYRTAYCYKQRKDYGNAVYFFQKAISKDESKAHWHLNLAESLLELNKEDKALLPLKKVLSLNPKKNKKITQLLKKLKQGIPEEDTFVNSIILVDPNNVKMTISGYTEENPDLLFLEFYTRKNKIDLQAFSHTIDIKNITLADNGIFEAEVILPLSLLVTEDSNVVNHTWDFNLIINNKKVRLKYFQESKNLLKYNNFDIIPYQTNSKTFSIFSIRKNSKIQQTDKKHLTLIITRIDEETFFIQNMIKLANILASLSYQVTLVTLDLKVNQNNFAISPKVNFDYVSTVFLSDREKDIDFNSSNVIPSESYVKDFQNYFSHLNTDILYLPIFGEFFLNKILVLKQDNITTILAEYNKRRYISYINLLSNNNEISMDMVINKVQSQHFFENINVVSAVHIIYPEVASLFKQITDKTIITTALNEDDIRKEWEQSLVLLNKNNQNTEDIFY
ncbi:MAG: Unknown protein [uncultured Sulfurovum sp.]|uniref:Uncharacterized protein n=1 Tax=uncultured Sulfurovum sp. TaxID=269237 RepID=A0A6S6TUA2_9BACT|nr:MAG: Unknown protein [uncultured Sulfurovum sp.]